MHVQPPPPPPFPFPFPLPLPKGLQLSLGFFECAWIHGMKLLSLVGNSGTGVVLENSVVMKLFQMVAGHAPP